MRFFLYCTGRKPAECNASRAIVIFVTVLFLLNAMAPTLVYAATYLQGAEVNANALLRDAYVAVTYRDSNGQEKTEKGWIDAIGETSFTIRSGGLKSKKTIAYDKVLSVIMSDESTVPAKQMNEVNRFVREKKEEELKAITIMSGGQIDLSKIRKGWYAHVIYTSEGKKETVTGRITKQDSVHIVIRVQEGTGLKIRKTIAYTDIDTLVILQHRQSIQAWKNTRHIKRALWSDAKVRIQALQRQAIGRLAKMTSDTLVIQSGRTFFSIPRASISRLEVSIRQRNTREGMLFGFVLGLGVLAPIAIADASAEESEGRGLATYITALYVSLPIYLLSTLIGAAIKSDKWIEVPPQSLNLSLASTSTKGLRAALTFNF